LTIPSRLAARARRSRVDETFIGKPDEVFVLGKGWQSKRGTATKRKVLTLVAVDNDGLRYGATESALRPSLSASTGVGPDAAL
jgi:hypothetical protein